MRKNESPDESSSEAMEKLTIPDLIERYEKDIIFGHRHLESRISRSKARWELVRRGKPALPEIMAHLERVKFSEGGELAQAWNRVLQEI
jgi:hypothetical protein